MNAREEIFVKIRNARQETPAVLPWNNPPAENDLVAKFTQILTQDKGQVIQVEDLEKAWDALGTLLKELGAARGVYQQEPPLTGNLLAEKFPGVNWKQAVGPPEQLREMCLEADVGLTGAQFALAETGTIGVVSNQEFSGLTSLLPETHIVMLDRKLMVPDLITWEKIRPKTLPAQLVLISGPSKTADIEQTLVVGAHGPKRFVVIVYGG